MKIIKIVGTKLLMPGDKSPQLLISGTLIATYGTYDPAFPIKIIFKDTLRKGKNFIDTETIVTKGIMEHQAVNHKILHADLIEIVNCNVNIRLYDTEHSKKTLKPEDAMQTKKIQLQGKSNVNLLVQCSSLRTTRTLVANLSFHSHLGIQCTDKKFAIHICGLSFGPKPALDVTQWTTCSPKNLSFSRGLVHDHQQSRREFLIRTVSQNFWGLEDLSKKAHSKWIDLFFRDTMRVAACDKFWIQYDPRNSCKVEERYQYHGAPVVSSSSSSSSTIDDQITSWVDPAVLHQRCLEADKKKQQEQIVIELKDDIEDEEDIQIIEDLSIIENQSAQEPLDEILTQAFNVANEVLADDDRIARQTGVTLSSRMEGFLEKVSQRAKRERSQTTNRKDAIISPRDDEMVDQRISSPLNPEEFPPIQTPATSSSVPTFVTGMMDVARQAADRTRRMREENTRRIRELREQRTRTYVATQTSIQPLVKPQSDVPDYAIKEASDEFVDCKICFERCATVFIQCSHRSMCPICFKQIETAAKTASKKPLCPICKDPILSHIYTRPFNIKRDEE